MEEDAPVATYYSLTEKGVSLCPVFDAIEAWAEEWMDDDGADEGRRAALREQFREAQSEGITGVPTFVADGYAARGAVPPEQLRRLVEGT